MLRSGNINSVFSVANNLQSLLFLHLFQDAVKARLGAKTLLLNNHLAELQSTHLAILVHKAKNEIFYVCEKLGVDSNTVARVAAMDERIGKYGTIHGKAFGGKCLPKDLRALIRLSEHLGYDPELLKAVEKINKTIRAERGVRE